MFEVFANDYRITIQEIPLGNQGEDMARCLVIDITDAVLEFGSGGTVSVRNKRNGDELPYFCTNVSTVTGADSEGNVHTYIKWTLTDVDTAAAGSGFVQADYIISGVTVKTWVYKYFILPSLGITGDVPDPYEDILEEIEAQVSAVQAAAASAAASAAQASAEATRIISTTQEVVEDWLSEHIVTGYTVDDTLTISGAAADSKKAGDMIRAAFVTEHTSGSIASFTDGADNVPVKEVVVNITPIQSGSGDPSPTNIRPITGWARANIIRCGANFLGDNAYTSRNADFTLINNGDGSYTINGTCTSSKIIVYNFYTDSISQSQNDELRHLQRGQYWLDAGCDNTGVKLQICGTNITGTSDVHVSAASNATLVTVDDTYKYNWVRLLVNAGTYENVTLRPFIVRADDSNRAYTKYEQDLYSISFGSAGTVYGGTLDVTTGMLTVTYSLRTGFPSRTLDSSGKLYALGNTLDMVRTGASEIVPTWSNYFNTNYSLDTLRQLTSGYGLCVFNRGTFVYGFVGNESALDAILPNITLAYPLENPISVQLSATEIRTLLGNNNIWSDTGSVSSCEYRADTKLYLEKLTVPDSDMVADSNITSGSYFMVGNSLYLATANIANGGAITPGTNCTATNLAAALNAINS